MHCKLTHGEVDVQKEEHVGDHQRGVLGEVIDRSVVDVYEMVDLAVVESEAERVRHLKALSQGGQESEDFTRFYMNYIVTKVPIC